VLWLPPPPPDDAAGLSVAGREVPFIEVVALEDTPVLPLVVDRTVAFELDTEDVESADVWPTFNAADVVLPFPEDSAEVDDAGVEIATLEDAVSSPFPELAAAPDPAPDDEPAVFDAMAVGAVLTEVA
jgi:hypothetical protein